MRLDVPATTCAALAATLSYDERIRSARMRTAELEQRFIAAHGALRKVLGMYLGAHPGELCFVENEYGKPALSGEFAGRLEFNLSHSADLAVIGVAANREIGVDVEHVRDEPDFAAVARWFFAAEEVEELSRLPSELRARAFLGFWTRKEAYAKARGEGLGATNEIAGASGWSVYSLEPAPGYVGALVAEGSGWRVTQRFASMAESGAVTLSRSASLIPVLE